jgi:peptidoglycan-N-acetylmuramic acid deacetylase
MALHMFLTSVILAGIMSQSLSMAEIKRADDYEILQERLRIEAQIKAEEEAKRLEEEALKAQMEQEKKAEENKAALEALKAYQVEENLPSVGYNDGKSWWFRRTNTNVPPTAQGEIAIQNYDAYYLGDITKNVIYLTFDEGYENGCTEKILDILKENDVKAAFFVTKPYMESEPELVKRMVEEGHIVGNHSDTHPNMTTLSDEDIKNEIESCAQYFNELTGQEMPKFFRPPEGAYSIRTLEKTQELGYKTIFWSFAYRDWVTDDQPGAQVAYETVMNNYHNGCIMLLHAVSESNTEALDSILKDLKAKGYSFESLENLP